MPSSRLSRRAFCLTALGSTTAVAGCVEAPEADSPGADPALHAEIRTTRHRGPPGLGPAAGHRVRAGGAGRESVRVRGGTFVRQVRGRATGRVPAALTDVGKFPEGAEAVLPAIDYADGLDAFTGGSLASSVEMTEHVRRTGTVPAGATPWSIVPHAQAHYMLDRLDGALATPPRT